MTELPSHGIKITEWTEQAYFEGADNAVPSKFFIRNGLGNYIFYHTRSRAAAQLAVDEDYGKGMYTIRASRLDPHSGNYSVRA